MTLDPETDLVLTRTVNAPRDLLFECWTTPRHLTEFFVPKPHKVVACDLDVRVGGRCNTTFEVDGTLMENNGVYLEVIPNEKLVFTDTYTEGWKPAAEPFMTAIIQFADAGAGRTTYTAIARHRNPETRQSHEAMGFHDGWGTVVTQLEDYAQGVLARTMTIERIIDAPPSVLWQAWSNPESLPQWWGPDGFSCRTRRIDLRAGGEWVFDMIAPDGTEFPNHHRITRWDRAARIDYTLLWGEDGPRHADSSVLFEDLGNRTRVTLRMSFVDLAEYQTAKGFGAEALGLQTLGKLARAVGAA